MSQKASKRKSLRGPVSSDSLDVIRSNEENQRNGELTQTIIDKDKDLKPNLRTKKHRGRAGTGIVWGKNFFGSIISLVGEKKGQKRKHETKLGRSKKKLGLKKGHSACLPGKRSTTDKFPLDSQPTWDVTEGVEGYSLVKKGGL